MKDKREGMEEEEDGGSFNNSITFPILQGQKI